MDLTLGHTRAIIDECQRQGLLRNQAAYVLATAFWETARTMKPVVEAFWKTEDWRKRNLRYYPWHGRGFVQLTWERNYIKAAKEIGRPLDKNPELALDPVIAATVLVTGSREGWFTGKKLADFITLQKSDFDNARRIINGKDSAGEIAKIAREYDAELKDIGYGVDMGMSEAADTVERGPTPPPLSPATRPTPTGPTPAPAPPAGFWARLLALFNRKA